MSCGPGCRSQAQRWLKGFSQLQIAAFTVLAGAAWLLLMLPLVMVTGVIEIRVSFTLETILLVLFAGIVPIAIGNFCWHYGVSRVGVVVASLYNNLLPAAALGTTLLMGGSFAWQQILGTAIILVGVLSAQLVRQGATRACVSACGAPGGTRTPTSLRTTDFEFAASTIPPQRRTGAAD